MRTRSTRSVAVVAMVALLSLPASARADEQCTPWLGLGPVTVGVGGQDIITTPWAAVQVCRTVETAELTDVLNDPPSVYVENLPHTFNLYQFAIWLNGGGGPVYGASVTLRYVLLDGTVKSETIVVPVPAGSGGSTCVFYHGMREMLPPGCLVYVIS